MAFFHFFICPFCFARPVITASCYLSRTSLVLGRIQCDNKGPCAITLGGINYSSFHACYVLPMTTRDPCEFGTTAYRRETGSLFRPTSNLGRIITLGKIAYYVLLFRPRGPRDRVIPEKPITRIPIAGRRRLPSPRDFYITNSSV